MLDCHDGIRLGGVFNAAAVQPAPTMAILIHGWEGSAESLYMLSLTAALLAEGIDVFRLNLPDHGDTHHLNEGIFNSTMVPEVLSGLEDLQRRYPSKSYSLIGFSLGGNFALRVAARALERRIDLDRAIAFCPVLHAQRSNKVLNSRSNFVYGQYFVHRWKRSLRKKLEYFPKYQYGDQLATMKSLDEMNQRLIPNYTEFNDVDRYFEAYAITGSVLAETSCPCFLHFAKDDMMIPWHDIEHLAENPSLDVTLTEHGGHCGFISNWRFDSWQDQRAIELIKSTKISLKS